MIRLQVLGAIGLTGEDGRDVRPVLTQPKRVGLLAYLALAEPEGFRRRDTLLALFWPELGDEEARRALRQALHFLRQHLGQNAIENRGTDEVRLSRTAFVCDAWAFDYHLARGEDADALAYYGGELLAGFHVGGAAEEFDEWLARRRAGFHRDSLLAARRASLAAEQAGRADEAELWARFAIDRDDVEEGDIIRLVRLLHAAGDRAAALAAHESYARLLEERYESEPGPELHELVNRIRQELSSAAALPRSVGELIADASSPTVVPEPDPEAAPRPAPLAAAVPLTSTPIADPAPAARRFAKRRAVLLAAIVALGLAAMLPVSRFLPARAVHRSSPVEHVPPIVAVAILANRTADSTLEQLGTIAAEWISRGLSRAPDFQVLDLNAMYLRGRAASGEPVDPMTLAHLSHARYVVGGEYHRVGTDSLRFAAEVLDGVTGRIVRSVDPIVGSVADPIPAVDELRDRMASAIQSIVDPRAVMLDAPDQPPPRYDAFREFVIGQEAFWSADYENALAHTLRAAHLDTSFAMASVFVTVVAVSDSRCYLVDSITAAIRARISNLSELERATLGMSGVRCRRDWQEGIRLQRRRLALQPNSPVVKWTAAQTYELANRPLDALAIFREIDLERDFAWLPAPGRSGYYNSLADAYHQLSDFAAERRVADTLRAVGTSDLAALFLSARSAVGLGDMAAVDAALAALATSEPAPVSPAAFADEQPDYWIGTPGWVRTQLAAELAAHGHEAAARSLAKETAEQMLREQNDTARSAADRFALGRALLIAGRPADAESVFEGLVRLYPRSIRVHGLLGVAAAAAGDARTAEETRRWIAARTGAIPPGLPRYYLAAIAANAGELSDALDLIEGMPYGAHPYAFIEFHVDPVLAPLRGEARFKRFLRPR